jgi:hypothetical protein
MYWVWRTKESLGQSVAPCRAMRLAHDRQQKAVKLATYRMVKSWNSLPHSVAHSPPVKKFLTIDDPKVRYCCISVRNSYILYVCVCTTVCVCVYKCMYVLYTYIFILAFSASDARMIMCIEKIHAAIVHWWCYGFNGANSSQFMSMVLIVEFSVFPL